MENGDVESIITCHQGEADLWKHAARGYLDGVIVREAKSFVLVA